MTPQAKHIQKSSSIAQKSRTDFTLFNKIYVFLKDRLPDNIDIKRVLKRIENTVPERLTYELDAIYIGDFDELNKREIESLFIDGSVLITNKQKSELLLYETMLHEIGHSVEKTFAEQIYSDGLLKQEFLNKRKKMLELVKREGYEIRDEKEFYNIDFDQQFDDFLYKVIGYDKLNYLLIDVFLSPYGATSLREYFANVFENYFTTDDPMLIKKICPMVYKKISSLTKENW